MSTTVDAAVRLRKQQLDDLRRELGRLFQQQDALNQQLAAIDAELDAEMAAASGMALANFSAFHARNRVSHGATLRQIGALDDEIETLQAQVGLAFEDFKAVDIAAERQRELARTEAARKEQGTLDDIAAQRHASS